jgi:hypothetical protein
VVLGAAQSLAGERVLCLAELDRSAAGEFEPAGGIECWVRPMFGLRAGGRGGQKPEGAAGVGFRHDRVSIDYACVLVKEGGPRHALSVGFDLGQPKRQEPQPQVSERKRAPAAKRRQPTPPARQPASQPPSQTPSQPTPSQPASQPASQPRASQPAASQPAAKPPVLPVPTPPPPAPPPPPSASPAPSKEAQKVVEDTAPRLFTVFSGPYPTLELLAPHASRLRGAGIFGDVQEQDGKYILVLRRGASRPDADETFERARRVGVRVTLAPE